MPDTERGVDPTVTGDAYPVEVPYAHAAAFDAARKAADREFRAPGSAPWRNDPSAIAGYNGGFSDGWHARDAELERLRQREVTLREALEEMLDSTQPDSTMADVFAARREACAVLEQGKQS